MHSEWDRSAEQRLAVRFNALSRSIESALQKEGIPSRVLAGHKFFERLEVSHFWLFALLAKGVLDQRPFGISSARR